MTAAPLPDGTLAGYRLVRRLGSGSRADVYLGVGSTASVALKVFRAETNRDSIAAELEALGRVESPHLPQLVDISTATDGTPILVLERIGQGSLSTRLAARESIECGEAVTLLAPLATLLGELADGGVAHTRIGAASVFLGSDGGPVLMGFGHCLLFEAGGTMAAIDADPAAATDRNAFARLAIDVLSRVRDAGTSNRVGDLVRWIEEAPRAYEFPSELAERLFACAEPLPIAMSTTHPAASTVPSRVVPESKPVPEPWPPPPVPHDPMSRAAVPVGSEEPPSQLPTWLTELLQDNPAAVLKKRAIAFARGVRPRFWVIAATALVGLVIAATLIPSGGAPTAEPVPPTEVPSAPVPTRKPAALPDDPLEASKILLVTRATCLHDLSILCLDGVDEASSSAFTTDAASVQQVQQGGELPQDAIPTGTQLVLTERLGDTALIGLTPPGAAAKGTPVSILVIRTKTGWRIRDYLSGAQATTP
jgi:eukaryotic-like serine/threonine-protein kinase